MKTTLAVLALASGLVAAPAAFADSNSFQGTFWSLSYSGSALPDNDNVHETYRITLSVDTNGYTGSGAYLDQIGFKISSRQPFSETLVSAPDGVSAWSLVPGGISANRGCSGNGNDGFLCANSLNVLNSGKGVAINPGNGSGVDYTWVFDVTVNNGKLFTGADDASVKARFVDSYGRKAGDLVSEDITLAAVTAVPEPETYAMLLAGLGLMGFVARRRSKD